MHPAKFLARLAAFLGLLSVLLTGCAPAPGNTPGRGIVFQSNRDGNWELYWMDAAGGEARRLTRHSSVDADAAWSPDGRQIAFRSRRDGSSDIFVMDAGGGLRNLISDPPDSPDDEFAPKWRPDGEMLAVYTDRFPPRGRCSIHQLALLPAGGGRERIALLANVPGGAESFDWSPDGQSLVYIDNCQPGGANFWVYNFRDNTNLALTSGGRNDLSPAWSPDGEWIVFASDRDGDYDLYQVVISSREVSRLVDLPGDERYPSFSPDGRRLVFTASQDGNEEIYMLDLASGGLTNLTTNPADDRQPDWSPVP